MVSSVTLMPQTLNNWINQRLKSIDIRKDLTNQWKAHNVQEGVGYATE